MRKNPSFTPPPAPYPYDLNDVELQMLPYNVRVRVCLLTRVLGGAN